jgi:ribosomal protein RSM22 (predicted rRNA methylase)
MPKKSPEDIVKSELELYEEKELALQQLTQELESSPQFAAFLEAQRAFREVEANVWKNVEQAMMDNNIKSIKTDKVTLSIATRTSYDIDLDLLPKKFIKRVPDTTKIATAHKLKG